MDEFTVRLATSKVPQKHSVFKLHRNDNIEWSLAKLKREHENHPWQIKVGSGRQSRRFKAVKEGGVSDNASYYVFYKAPGKVNSYEVCPIDEWYSVSATQRYKTLTSEEAEKKFEERHKTYNLFSVMHVKNRGENGDEMGGHDSKAFKISELDDWADSGNEDFSDSGDEDSKKKKTKQKKVKKEEDPDNAPAEAGEESDEGDFEQREVDYITDSSSSSSSLNDTKDKTDVKGIAEEGALRGLLDSDGEEEGESQPKANDDDPDSPVGLKIKLEPGQGSDLSSESGDDDIDGESSMQSNDGFVSKSQGNESNSKQDIKVEPEAGPSKSQPQAASKVRRPPPELDTFVRPPPARRPCIEPVTAANSRERVIENLIRKYLSRKPMSITNLLKCIKSKIKNESEDVKKDLLVTIAAIIKSIADKKKINDTVYLYLKTT